MGHVTFLVLLGRETLSLFHCVYGFERRFYHEREPLWISACAELEAFVGIMILIEADWVWPWLPNILASDFFGHGVAQGFCNPSDVAAVGRIPEVKRWRCGAALARRHAFESAGFSCRFM